MTISRLRRPFGLCAGLVLVATSAWSGGASAEEEFVAGSGRARANLFEVLPRTGGLTLPVSFGRAVASYQGTVARAGSLAIRPPSEPPTSAAAECGGQAPDPPGGGGGGGAPGLSFPFASNLETSSDQPEGERTREASFLAGPAGGPVAGAVQHQRVTTGREPFGEAATTSGRLVLDGGAEIVGGRAEASAGIVDGRARVARATVVIDRLSLFDGTVTLEDLRWEAVQRTGDEEALDGGFTVGRITVAGAALPSPEGEPPLAVLNTALGPTGLAFETPRLHTDGGVAHVSPLSVRMADSALGRELFGPVLGEVQPVRDPLVDALLAVHCDFGLAVTVADVILGVASGSGGVSFDFGGALATTEGIRYENPFGGPLDGVPLPGTDLMPPPSATTPEPSFQPPAIALPTDQPSFMEAFPPLGTRTDGAAGLPGGDEMGIERPALPAAQPGPATTTSHVPGRRGGTALAVGLIGLAAVVALAMADAAHVRRKARTIP